MTHDLPSAVRPDAAACPARFSNLVDLTAEEERMLHDLCSPAFEVGAAQRIRTEGDEQTCLFFLHHGWVLSSIDVADGSRQVVKVHRSGDIMGAPGLPYDAAAASLIALTPAWVSAIPLNKLGRLFSRSPRLGAVLYLLAQEERVTLMDRLVAVGRLDAKRSLIALLLLMHREDPSKEAAVHFPLTQIQIGDVLGLSSVHVNRVLRDIDGDGLIRRSGHTYVLLDVPGLEAMVGLPRRERRRNLSWLPPPR